MNKEPLVGYFELNCITGLSKVDTVVTLVPHQVPNRPAIEADDDLGDCACAVNRPPLGTGIASDEPECPEQGV
jgi:hypothetical protein